MRDLPCLDCITLAICQNKREDYGSAGGCFELAKKCSLLESHLNLYDIRPKGQILLKSRRAGLTYEENELAELQCNRIIQLIKFMGWQLRIGDTDETEEEEKKKLQGQTKI